MRNDEFQLFRIGNAGLGKLVVENNYLSSKDVLNLHKELEAAEKTGADKQGIYERYAEVSKKNREEAVAESCSGNPFCANGVLSEGGAGSDIANSLKRLPLGGGVQILPNMQERVNVDWLVKNGYLREIK